MKTTLVIFTYNEILGVKEILPRIKKEWVDEIIVVDGGSTDGTVEYAEKLGFKIIKQKSKGITNAYKEAVKASTGDVIISFSPDGNSIPEVIPKLVEKMREGYDIVIASRYLNGAKSYDDDIVTAFGNWFFTKVINILFKGKYTDTLVMLRAWKKDLIKMLTINAGRAGIEPHLSILGAKRKLKVTEIPVDEPKRIGNKRKMHPLINGFAIILLIIKEFFNKK